MVYLSKKDSEIVIRELSKNSDEKIKAIVEKLKNPKKRIYVRSHNEIKRLLKKAFKEKRKIKIKYYSPHSDESTFRMIQIYEIHDNVIQGYCELRDDERIFRIDRINSAMLLDEKYFIPKGWKPENKILYK
jgi:predicted DNA-binding transcriptional regulator YafY